jgi:hypothetical protein
MSTGVSIPRDIEYGDGVGSLCVRQTQPGTSVEQQVASALPTSQALWRVVLWHKGHVFITVMVGGTTPPLLAALISHYNDMPVAWSEIVRSQKS